MRCSNEEIIGLIKEIVNPKATTETTVDLAIIEDIIFKQIPQAMRNNAPLDFPDLFFNFTEEYNRFKDFLVFEPLIGKRVVALGGGFSSGKSAFLNSVMNRQTNENGQVKAANILPSAINPSTSVPTYVVNADKEVAFGINMFNSRVKLNISDIKPIAHGFAQNEQDDTDNTGIKLGHLLKTIFAATPFQSFENIAFLDTPGYSKPDTSAYTDRTDEKIARQQLNTADCIIWFISADKGTFPEDDIRFLESLENRDTPKLIVVNKADSQTDENLKSIVSNIKELAKLRRIDAVDVLTFSRKKGTEDKYDRAKIMQVLSDWNKPITTSGFAYNFSLLFLRCRDYFMDCENEERERLSKLNRAILLAGNNDASEFLYQLKVQSADRIQLIDKISKELNDLRGSFFKELRRISSVIGIDLPEADEIELAYSRLQSTGESPLKAAEELCAELKVKLDTKFERIIEEELREVSTDDINAAVCGESKAQKQIYDMLTEFMRAPENRIN